MNTYTGPALLCPDPTEVISDQYAELKARETEDVADSLLADCLTLAGAEKVFMGYDLAETKLPANLLMIIANWNGRSDQANDVMRKLNTLLANELHSVAQAIQRGIY